MTLNGLSSNKTNKQTNKKQNKTKQIKKGIFFSWINDMYIII